MDIIAVPMVEVMVLRADVERSLYMTTMSLSNGGHQMAPDGTFMQNALHATIVGPCLCHYYVLIALFCP